VGFATTVEERHIALRVKDDFAFSFEVVRWSFLEIASNGLLLPSLDPRRSSRFTNS